MKTTQLLVCSSLLGAALLLATQPVAAQEFTLAQPREGEQFQPGDPIPLRATASDDTARPWQVAFLDGDRLIAEANVNTTVWWENAGGGPHVLTARATNPDGTTLTTAPVRIQVGPGPTLPVVSIRADPWQTAEPCPTCRIIPARLTLRRSSPTVAPLVVYLQVDGTATPGEDYPALPERVEFPAGQDTIQLSLGAFDDLLAEGPEVVRVRLAPNPAFNALTYLPSVSAREALIVIGDDEPEAPEARLDIILPKNGQHFPLGGILPVTALAVWSQGEVLEPVDFYAGNQLIGRTPGSPVMRPPIAGLPSVHTIVWTNPPAGEHALRARTTLAPDRRIESPPVRIVIDPEVPPLPVVRIVATQRLAEEDCAPLERLPLAGVFTISRTGPTDNPLPVFVQYSGMAAPGIDYPPPPLLVTIPAGAISTDLRIVPTPDNEVEGLETLVATVSNCPPDRDPALGIPCYGFEVDPAHASATVYIRDDAHTVASLAITQPRPGATFPAGAEIPINAVAIDLNGAITRVEFWDGERSIGVSEIVFIRAPDPGTPIFHQLVWRQAGAGPHVLTARAVSSSGVRLSSPPVPIAVGDTPSRTVVRIEATQPIAEEDSLPYDRFPLIGVFTISRTGPTEAALPVFVQYTGIARPEADYPPLPWLVTIPAGAVSTEIRVVPNQDGLAEGLETLVATISNCPPPTDPPMGIPCYAFEVDPARARATVFLRDDGVTVSSLVLTAPPEGATFPAGQPIGLEAVAVDLEGYLPRVEFYAGDRLIGVSQIEFIRAPDPGTPIYHHFEWRGALPGTHVLTARVVNPDGSVKLASNPVNITVAGEPPRNVLRIDATRRIAEESSYPYRRLLFVGELTITRTGPTNAGLPVFVQYAGTATPGKDYAALPWLVTIPAGATSTVIRVEAIPDDLAEGIETLVATLSNCPPSPMGMPCYAFDIDPAHASATVFLRDDGLTVASLALEQPQDGARFDSGATIPLLAIAIDLESYISRVEFWDGDRRIGVSEITFVRAPDPGTPIHHPFAWQGAANGGHTLTARAVDSAGTAVQSPPVRITVGTLANQPPTVAIVRPAAGAEFPPSTAIEIAAEARDTDGYVRRVEFFADGRKLGEAGLAVNALPPPGEKQTFTFVWRSPSPGRHVLTAQATDNQGGATGSAPVEIRVTEPEPVPLVAVMATDPFAMEPGANAALNTAAFRFRRFGPTNAALVISYSLRGTAQNGVDFETLPGLVTLPAGQRTIDLIVRPLKDELVERLETVSLQLGESPVMGPLPQYRIGIPARAVAVISDSVSWRPADLGRCLPIGDGTLHVCFGAESGAVFRVEASRDLKDWETLCDAVAVDGTVHVVDEDAPSGPQRFYRILPEPLGVSEP